MRTFVLALSALLVTSCAAQEPAPPEPKPHGYVEGAEETAEAQSRLVVADGADGAVRVLDLITEEVQEPTAVPGAQHIATDGRFAYVTGDSGVRIIDSGAWTVDHGDHVHHYRAAVRDLGEVPGRDPQVHSDTSVTALSSSDGAVALLDRERLEDGEIRRTGTARVPAGSAALPYEQHVLAPDEAGVRVLDRSGREVGRIDQPCAQPRGAAITRRGAVFGCASGALLVTADRGAFRGEAIPHPPGAPRAAEFHHRPGSDTLAARAGQDGAWSLDLAERSWTHVRTGPVAAVNAVGSGGPLLVLGADGVLRSYDDSGAETARVPVTTPEAARQASVHVDTSRAYVNDVAGGAIHEIDYNDSLRIARTFRVGERPAHVVETGR